MIRKDTIKTSTYLLIFLLMISMGFHLYDHSSYGQIAVSAEEVDRYKLNTELLLKAVEELGVCTPNAALDVFIKSIKDRNGAMMYSILCDSLKKNYLSRLEENSPYWVTGVSSPWVSQVDIIKETKKKDGSYEYELLVKTLTSAGPDREYKGELTIQRDGDFYKICRIFFEKDFGIYTGVTISGKM
ncbi:hypothetical protein [Lachnoclostridium sp.]|uniref:hypothetical protein n=1 Tax=Lachnoclostridium sp. TaxID=2028282 RepID=UPI0028964359|nr:hypothetical protein [Lachnoclostridium sp.]